MPFGGKGKAVASDSAENAAGSTAGAVRKLSDLGNGELQMGRDDFLKQIPATVMRGGEMVDVRAGVAELLGVDTSVSKEGAKRSEGVARGGTRTSHSMEPVVVDTRVPPEDVGTTLQVKSSDGLHALVLRMRADHTIKDLREFVDDHRPSTSRYQLRTRYPNRAYDDPEQTLKDAGLCPNAVIMLRVGE